jgi:HSP20 family protein
MAQPLQRNIIEGFHSLERPARRTAAMAIELWDPFREAVSLRDAMNSLLQDSFVRPVAATGGGDTLRLPLDVRETGNEFVIHASMPGVKPEDVHITVHGDTLTIRGEGKSHDERKGENWLMRERRFGSFSRSISLGTPVEADKAHTTFEHGILTLTLPKAESAKPKEIKVAAAAAQSKSKAAGETKA